MLIDLLAIFLGAALELDDKLSLVPGYSHGRALVLDTILGPVESFEHVSATAPSSPPPHTS